MPAAVVKDGTVMPKFRQGKISPPFLTAKFSPRNSPLAKFPSPLYDTGVPTPLLPLHPQPRHRNTFQHGTMVMVPLELAMAMISSVSE